MDDQPDRGRPLDGPEFVRSSVVDGVGWLEFDRPPVNAFNRQMVEETLDALRHLERSSAVRVVVLASAVDRYFSAGADLQVFAGMGEDGMRSWVELVHDVVRALRGLTKPALAAISGTAVGGGLEMTLHCDVRFAERTARLGQPEINIGFIPPVGATQALARLLGRPAALRYLYDGELLDAETCAGIGLVDEVVDPGGLRSTVQSYASRLAERPPEALAAIRRAVTIGGGATFDEGLAIEADLAVRLAGTANFEEGVRAFLERRSPRWDRP
jgi:enoyl-CoA hydratase/carnithine racemase